MVSLLDALMAVTTDFQALKKIHTNLKLNEQAYNPKPSSPLCGIGLTVGIQ
jgi:hypothetical protein